MKSKSIDYEMSEKLIALCDQLIAHFEQDTERLLNSHGNYRVEKLLTAVDELRLREIVFHRIVQ